MIWDLADISLGADITKFDLRAITTLCRKILKQKLFIKDLNEYQNQKTSEIAPILSRIVGERIASQLINKAGGI